MSKTIKVIDLLNKIANGEELPEEIKYDNTIWQYNKAKTDYYQDIGSTKLYFFADSISLLTFLFGESKRLTCKQ